MREAYAWLQRDLNHLVKRARNSMTEKLTVLFLKPGDRVLAQNLSKRGGPGKFGSCWENTVHEIVDRKGERESPSSVKPENGAGRCRVIHLVMICPLNYDRTRSVERQNEFSKKQIARNTT